VLVAVLLKGVELEHLLKFSLAAAIALPLCFALAHLLRKLPGVSRVL